MSAFRLGSIEFANSLPVDLGILSGAVPAPVRVITGTPFFLNGRMAEGELDASPVSAIWYARHQRDFLLLPDLSISSRSGVQSVLLFSRLRLRDLDEGRIAVTTKGETTPVLLEILCRLRYGFRPQWVTAENGEGWIPDDADAVLLIGDDALAAREHLKGRDLEIIDVADEWERWTRMPFVFAVWVVRKEAAAADPAQVARVHGALLESRHWGFAHPEEVLKAAACKTGLDSRTLRFYFSKLSYDFGEDLKAGMRIYFEYAVRCGLLEGFGPFAEWSDLVPGGHVSSMGGVR